MTEISRTSRNAGWPFAGVVYGVREIGSTEYRYVGMTTRTVSSRRKQHFKAAREGRKRPVYDWLRKYENPESVYFESLELVMSDSLTDLFQAERRWIAALRDRGDRLLNLTDGGDGVRGYVWTEEQRRAAGERARGRPTGVHRRGPDSPHWGRRLHSDEQRARWSEMRKGSITGELNPNYGKFGPAHPSYGRKRSDETRARLSEQKRGERNPNFGKTMSEEGRRRRSEKLKGRPMPSSRRSAHTRHHTNKGVFKDTCDHCLDDMKNLKGSTDE
ncbi:NUMOD3 domain-containing DNA-binding protein [Microbacterium sp. Root53]|uniref:NUMOD3 domain-containing DNA-binding protein n=1 Tax=Microbacterium sp. Root53 TaxID=1736553 RepID=UPI000A5BC44B|nr:NUMOD3 domain-containing DNA-binding protein [Microbacterium sp. Root53]